MATYEDGHLVTPDPDPIVWETAARQGSERAQRVTSSWDLGLVAASAVGVGQPEVSHVSGGWYDPTEGYLLFGETGDI